MNYTVTVARSAEKELNKIPSKIITKIEHALQHLGINPRPHQTKRLKDSIFYRLRVGDYRILYLIDDLKREVIISHIAHRKDAYR